jgi:hypothetical protein
MGSTNWPQQGFFFFSSPTGCPQLPSAMAARARELRGAMWLLPMPMAISHWWLAIGHGYWSLAMRIGHWLFAILYGYWLLIFTLRNVAMVITHFSYCPLSMIMFLTHWLLVFTLRNVAMVITHFGYCPLSMAMFIAHCFWCWLLIFTLGLLSIWL